MSQMIRNARTVVALCALTGVSLVGVIGWATGFFEAVFTKVAGIWNDFIGRINQPFDLAHIFAGAGGVLVAVGIALAIVFALADN